MTEYKGHRITTSVPNLWTSAAMANYRVERMVMRGWACAHEGTIQGSFSDLEAAHSAADAAARLWIDEHGNKPPTGAAGHRIITPHHHERVR
jgi:hypothetical protein